MRNDIIRELADGYAKVSPRNASHPDMRGFRMDMIKMDIKMISGGEISGREFLIGYLLKYVHELEERMIKLEDK